MADPVYRDDTPFVRSTFMITLGESFDSYAEAVAWSTSDERNSSSGVPTQDENVADSNRGSPEDKRSPIPAFFTKRKNQDTSLGGNPAINSFYQYGEDDDVAPHFLQTDFGGSSMGRVYNHAISDNQQMLYLSFGIPYYNNLTGFYTNVIKPSLVNYVNGGSGFSPREMVGLMGRLVTNFVLLPVMPLAYIYNALDRLTNSTINKYFEFRPDMPMYYQYANMIMINLSVNMGLSKDGRILGKDDSNGTGSQTQAGMTYHELYRTSNQDGGTEEPLPDAFSMAGWDIYRIMLRRSYYEKGLNLRGGARPDLSTDAAIAAARDQEAGDNTEARDIDKPRSYIARMFDSYQTGLYDANLFVGFKVQNDVDTSESISNTTGPSQVQQMLSSRRQAAAQAKHSVMNGEIIGGPVGAVLEGVASFIKGMVEGAGDALNLQGVGATILGAGEIDIPEIWQGSSFSKNYTFSMQLRSPYGDPVSIMQSIYVPLALILAGTIPRAIGPNAYTSPMLCRAYSKGMLGIPLGMIDSVQIKRGSDQHGWNVQRLPTSIDLSFTIKDLSPAMYMGMDDSQGLFETVAGENSSFQEYLQTLGALGLNERIRWQYKLRRKAEILLKIAWHNKLSPEAMGMNMAANTFTGRVLSAIYPRTGLPTD